MQVQQVIALILIVLIPILVFGFCRWCARCIPLQRTPHNTRFLARKITPHIVVSVASAIACFVIGVVGFVVMLIDSDEVGWILFWAAYTGFGVILGVATRPLFKIRASLRATRDDDDYSIHSVPVTVSENFGITFWWVVAIILSISAMLLNVGIFLVTALFFGLVLLVLWQRRRSREGQLLWLLALTVRSDNDLPRQIEDHAATWAGSYATRLRQLAEYLKAGRPLGVALERVPRLLPHWVIASIRIGDETGTLSEALNECATAQLNWTKERFRAGSISSLLIYLACYPWVILGPIAFMMYFIVPKFKAIFDGFGVEMPGITESFIRVCDVSVPFVSLLAPVTIVATLVLLRFDHSGWRNVRTRLFWRLYPRFDTSPILRHLARTIEKGKTLPESLLAIANSYHRPSVAESLAETYVDTESGEDCWQSLRKRGFLSARDMALIAAAQRVGNLPWALREIADVREQRYVFRVDTLVQLFRPVPIIVVGMFVGWVCIAMFLPVVKLVNDLS